MSPPSDAREARSGLLQAVGAYTIWGFMPLFFKQFGDISATEVVAHRIIWSVPLLLVIMAARGQLALYRRTLCDPALVRIMLLSSVLIAVNWLVYIYAVYTEHVVAASLGYFINPLFNVLLGYLFLGERLGRLQMASIALAGVGVAVLAFGSLSTLWISLALAFSFGFYGLVRKKAPVGSVPGLGAETTILLPVALGYAVWAFVALPGPGFGSATGTDLLLVAGGAVTAIPLLLFASAAKKMSYASLGFIQYIGPTLQFLLGVFFYGEPLTSAHLICFGCIWVALMLYSFDAWRGMRAARRAAAAEAGGAPA